MGSFICLPGTLCLAQLLQHLVRESLPMPPPPVPAATAGWIGRRRREVTRFRPPSVYAGTWTSLPQAVPHKGDPTILLMVSRGLCFLNKAVQEAYLWVGSGKQVCQKDLGIRAKPPPPIANREGNSACPPQTSSG